MTDNECNLAVALAFIGGLFCAYLSVWLWDRGWID